MYAIFFLSYLVIVVGFGCVCDYCHYNRVRAEPYVAPHPLTPQEMIKGQFV